MQITKSILFLTVVAGAARAQTCTNCGIGTNIPKSKFEIRGCGTDSTTSNFRSTRGDSVAVLFARDDKKVGINTQYPKNTLHIETSGSGGINLVSYSGSPSLSYLVNSTTTPSFMMGVDNSDSRFKIGTTGLGSSANRLTIDPTNANVGIGTNSPIGTAILDLTSTTKGVLIPRLTATQRTAIVSPADGLLVYQTTSPVGLYYYNNTEGAWQEILNTSTTATNQSLGYQSLISNSGVNYNTGAGIGAMYYNTSGQFNTATGYHALYSNSSGNYNTANGYQALALTTSYNYNTAVGYVSLYSNSTGVNNTALGVNTLYNNSSGYNNTAIGTNALIGNTTGLNNVAAGFGALNSNSSGYNNIAGGVAALYSNTTGISNASFGMDALYHNTTGSGNAAGGMYALFNSTGSFNAAWGDSALYTNTTGTHNTAIGYHADVSSGGYTNATAVGYGASVDASNKALIGNTAVTVIGGQVGWSTLSDGRFKKNVRNYSLGLNFIRELRPVSYVYNNNTNGIEYNGFIAQEVEQALSKLGIQFSGLCKPQNEKDNYSLRYGDFVVPLVNAVKELAVQNDSLAFEIRKLKETIALSASQGRQIRKEAVETRLANTEAEIEELKRIILTLTSVHALSEK